MDHNFLVGCVVSTLLTAAIDPFSYNDDVTSNNSVVSIVRTTVVE